MIHFINPDQAMVTYKEKSIANIVVPVSLDNISGSEAFVKMTAMYPELPEVFTSFSAGKTYKPGYMINLKMSNGDIVYLVVVKSVDKFQAYIADIMTALERVIEAVMKNNDNPRLMVPMITSQYTKLSDTILIPTIIQTLNVTGMNVYIVAGDECTSLIDTIKEDGTITWKQDTWKHDWMLQLDDILLIDIIHEVNRLTHGFKLAKSKMIPIYETCHKNGLFPTLEFTDGAYGRYFKMFMPKYMSLINHGLLMNTHHYARVTEGKPTKSDLRIGYTFPHIKHIAHTTLLEKLGLVKKIATIVRDDYLKQRKESYERYKAQQKDGKSNTQYQSNSNPFATQ